MRKLNSAVVYFLFVMAVMATICVRGAYGQQTCSTTTPCVPLVITNTNPVPSPAVLLSCVGNSTVCSQAALTASLTNQTLTTLCPTATAVWKCAEYSQSKTPQGYNDPEPWGSLVNYAIQGTTAGGVSAASPIITFQVPQQAPQIPSIGSVSKVVTSGPVGPQ